jgi:putative ABC transport system substrate-binding protein
MARWDLGQMRRREFIALLGGAAAAWPAVARGQKAAMPVVGFLDRGSPVGMADNLAGFHRGLAEAGFTDGTNVTVEYRWADNQYGRLPALAAELVGRGVDVIAATRSSAPALAAKAATKTIPIVFQTGSDPIKDGLVASLNRPGGNVTGATRLTTELVPKRLGIMSELVPNATRIGYLGNPNGVQTQAQVQEMQAATRARGLEFHVATASTEAELEGAFESLTKSGVAVLIEGSDPLFLDQRTRKQIVALTISHKIPTIFFERDSVVDGGLMTYAANFADSFRQVGVYAGRILNGAKPADLPVLQPTKFDLIINLKTARAIGLAIPPTLLALADEVIE